MSFALRYTSGDVQVLGLRSDRPQRLMGSAAMACVAFACSWTLAVNLAGPRAGAIDVSGTIFDAIEHPAPRGDKLVVTAPSPLRGSRPVSKSDAPLFDDRFTMGSAAQLFGASAPAQPRGWSVAALPAPAQPALETARDMESAPTQDAAVAQNAVPLRQPAPQSRTAALRDGAHSVMASAAADTRSIWDKLFGKPASALTLAYAGAETGSLGSGHGSGLYDRSTAVYDITAHKVYLPDGTTLEAHSGLGAMLDDPRHADVKMRGVTPPAVYDLQPREALFHGVEALRLIPEDESQALGRDGLLAHSYMLGPNGDSNGCVSFKDYEAFLQAYKNHEITRLAVVERLD
jgi:type VI secretion system (T6SS) effector TldE1-like protein